MLELLTIAPKSTPGRKLTRAKSHVFSARLLGYLATDHHFWDVPKSEQRIRPVWIAYLGTEQELQPFTANFRAGRPACARGDAFVIPRKPGHRFVTQRSGDVVITTAYLPELFHLEPAADDRAVRFVFAPPCWWIDEQAATLAADFGEDAEEAARAALFAAFLDRRTPMPIVNDLRFHVQLFRAARSQAWTLEMGSGQYLSFHGRLHPRCGLDAPLAVAVDAPTLRSFIASQTSIFHQQELQNGTHRFASDRRFLSDAFASATQLCLDFAVA